MSLPQQCQSVAIQLKSENMRGFPVLPLHNALDTATRVAAAVLDRTQRRLGAPTYVTYVLRKGSLSFEVVRDVLRALIACNEDWHQHRWAAESSEVHDISSLLGTDPGKVAHELRAVNSPTAEELDKVWFNPGGIDLMLANTAAFLKEVGSISSTALYTSAVNRTYLQAALQFPQRVDLRLFGPVRFALMIPTSGAWSVGHQIAGAAALAVETVNANTTLLPKRTLVYEWANSGCSAQQGLAAMGDLLQGEMHIDAVIGPGCSSACEVTSYLSDGQAVPQISWGWSAARVPPPRPPNNQRIVKENTHQNATAHCSVPMLKMSRR